jgi:hypothetical protein
MIMPAEQGAGALIMRIAHVLTAVTVAQGNPVDLSAAMKDWFNMSHR